MPTPRIDAHHHLWHYDPHEFAWLDDSMRQLRRDFLVPDLLAQLDQANIDAAIAVQARCSTEETQFLLACAAQTERIAAVVGWLPLTDPAALASSLEHFTANPTLRGIREIAQGQPAGFLLRPHFQEGITQLTRASLTYDVLIYANQLAEATTLVDLHPNQTFVLDHAAKPPIRSGELEPWATHLRNLAQRPNVTCKLSGLVTEADWHAWSAATLRPYLDVCVEAFGPQRLLAGSDWPMCQLAGGSKRWWRTLHDYFAVFTPAERDSIFGANAARVYRLPNSRSGMPDC